MTELCFPILTPEVKSTATLNRARGQHILDAVCGVKMDTTCAEEPGQVHGQWCSYLPQCSVIMANWYNLQGIQIFLWQMSKNDRASPFSEMEEDEGSPARASNDQTFASATTTTLENTSLSSSLCVSLR
jgi:hypothetical protein